MILVLFLILLPSLLLLLFLLLLQLLPPRNEEIVLTSCTVVGTPEEMPEPAPIVWGTQWTLPLAYEVLIGKKNDPFCFQTFPGNDSVGLK